MSTTKLREEIQKELIEANKYLHLINAELAEIKRMTAKDGPLESNVKESAVITQQLCELLGMPVQMGNITMERILPTQNLTLNTTQNTTFY